MNASEFDKAAQVVADLTAFAKAFIDNIDEWEGEPAPGQRWHKEYHAAKALIARTGGAA